MDMIGLGTIVNCAAVAAGTTAGVFLKSGLSERFEKTIMQGLGLCTCFIGVSGAVSGLLTVQDGAIGTQHTLLLVLSMAIGALIGEALNIEQRLEDFGDSVSHTLPPKGDNRFVEGFVTASSSVLRRCNGDCRCLNDGLSGDPTMLIAKAILDGVPRSVRRVARAGRIPVCCAAVRLSGRHYVAG